MLLDVSLDARDLFAQVIMGHACSKLSFSTTDAFSVNAPAM
jgi:hypothetical protein